MSRGGLTVLVGAPGSGKSTAAGRYRGVVLSSDAHRFEVCGDECDQDATAAAMSLLYTRCRTLLAGGTSVVVDATNTTPAERAALVAIARETGTDWTLALLVATPPQVCLERNSARPGPLPGRRWGRRVPEDLVQAAAELVAGLTYPQLFAEGFRYVQVLDQAGASVATYTHGGPPGVGVCPECTADAAAVAR